MCCLFGILDYGNSLSERQKKKLLSVLSVACEARGIDATGIAYRTGNKLCVYKRPLPAHRMHFRVPAETRYIMGHTRMTTQGSEKHNFNNHPFVGQAGGMPFALAHNGVLRNDKTLRGTEQLPATKIETDSYIAVQLIEQCGSLNFDVLRHMAELVRGSFNFTILDGANHLYIVKGSNPFCLYHWRKQGLYLYASTEEILQTTLQRLPFSLGRPEKIALKEGDILQIDADGLRSMEQFEPQYYYGMPFPYYQSYRYSLWDMDTAQDSYVNELKSVACAFGYTPEDIDWLIREGVRPEEIEEYFYSGEL